MATNTYLYELRLDPDGPPEFGEIIAGSEQEARRKLRVRYLCTRLPRNTRIIERDEDEREKSLAQSAKLRHLLRALTGHHRWLAGDPEGERANLSGLDLSGVDMTGANLTDADFSGADLSGVCLRGATLNRVNLSAATLTGADLSGASLKDADLSDSDLREARFVGASLDGADLWRANLRGCVIEPAVLHAGLGCSLPASGS